MDRILLESGDALLLESGDYLLLEEQPEGVVTAPAGHTVTVAPERRTVTVWPYHPMPWDV